MEEEAAACCWSPVGIPAARTAAAWPQSAREAERGLSQNTLPNILLKHEAFWTQSTFLSSRELQSDDRFDVPTGNSAVPV